MAKDNASATMKKKLIQISFLFSVVLGIYAMSASAQIAGGYNDAENNKAEVKRAAKVAVSSHSKQVHRTVTLIKINKAEAQVVAGMNYRICMQVRDGKHVRTVTAVVYQNLKNKYSLTNWK